MNIQELSIKDIQPYFKNAKKHPEKQIKKIANSIKEFGFNQPIVVDKNNVIIVGHGRYLAAQSLKIDKVPVLRVDLDEERAKAYRLSDNKLNESDWDMDIVIEELKTLSLQMIDLTGFDSDLILETKEDKPDLLKVGIPKTVEGDIYILGNHKIICGNSENKETYEKLLKKERPRLVFTDPPYSVDYKSQVGLTYSSEKYGGTGGKIFNDDKTPAEALQFYKNSLKNIYDFTSEDATLYWWFANRLTDINNQAMKETKWHVSQTCIWIKNQFVFSYGQLYHRMYEPCMVAWKEDTEHYKDSSFASFSDIWTLDKKTFADYLDLWYQKKDNSRKYIHPTQRPVQLAERAIKRSSEKDDVVLDAFVGSGSVMIACEQLGRQFRGIELDPKYCDAVVSRWCQFIQNNKIIKNGKEILWEK